jgi:hypothetical protein
MFIPSARSVDAPRCGFAVTGPRIEVLLHHALSIGLHRLHWDALRNAPPPLIGTDPGRRHAGERDGPEGVMRRMIKWLMSSTMMDRSTFRVFNADRQLVAPSSLDEWLPAKHLARLIAELVDEHLDLVRVRAAGTLARGSCDIARPAFVARVPRACGDREGLSRTGWWQPRHAADWAARR